MGVQKGRKGINRRKKSKWWDRKEMDTDGDFRQGRKGDLDKMIGRHGSLQNDGQDSFVIVCQLHCH